MIDDKDIATLAKVKKAKLPDVYVSARDALERCERIDECKDWADRASAIASYAKQAEDKALMNMAQKIRGRAVRRCGELLKQIRAKPGARTDKPGGGAPTRLQAAQNAGMSKDQAVTAIRVANVPENEFELAIESDNPPTVTDLAERGTKRKPVSRDHLMGASEYDFNFAIHLLGALKRFIEQSQKGTPRSAAVGSRSRADEAMALAIDAGAWLEQFCEELEKDK